MTLAIVPLELMKKVAGNPKLGYASRKSSSPNPNRYDTWTSSAQLRQEWKERVQAPGLDPGQVVKTVIGRPGASSGVRRIACSC